MKIEPIQDILKGWKRIKSQEGGAVKRWFEKGGLIISVVNGYFPNELNIRVGSPDLERFEIRGSKSIISERSDAEIIKTVEMHIKRKEAVI